MSQRFNLTRGDILSKLLLVSVPIVGSQLLVMSYNLVDMALLGRLSSDAVAASGSAGMYLWLANGFQLIGRMGAEIGVSQAKGRGDQERAIDFSHNSLFLSAILSIIIAILFAVIPEAFIAFLNIREPHVAAEAVNYLRIVAAGIPVSFIAVSIAGTFTGAGNSRAPFIVMGIGLITNIVLDPIFIFTLGMGVSGAAIATVIGQTIPCVISIVWLLRKKDRPFNHYPLWRRPVWRRIKQILAWTIPVSVESLLFTFFSMIVARFIAEFGADAITVYRVGSQAESLCWLLCLGFGSGVTAFVGQNFGAGRWTRIRECITKALAAIVAWGVFVTILFFLFGGQIFRLFVPEQRIVDMGSVYMWILAFSQVFFCLEAIAAGAFRGLGRTLPPSLVSVATNAVRVPLAYYLAQTSLGVTGIWWSICITASLRGLWIFLWFVKYFRTRPTYDETIKEDSWASSVRLKKN